MAPKLTSMLSHPAQLCVGAQVMIMDVPGDTWLIYHVRQPGRSTRNPAVLPVRFCLLATQVSPAWCPPGTETGTEQTGAPG